MLKRLAMGCLAAVLLGGAASAAEPAPPGARLYIIWPYDNQTIEGGKFWLRMGLNNVGIAPAGVRKEGTGHHHLLIDTDLPPLDEPIPSDQKHLHFGGGQTEARIELPPGEHTLQLILGDADHIPHDPPIVSEKITVIVP
ncbi:DUF4399 domain-containing protein [Geminicoccus roseus]|uniref:DUF4399 domain-containing protein n=1 Tax=Geminicoccus roseus TaxID=404900 RepID=UPI0004243082|nr:DUF4399 domain-containing protein [Geminicoccus roseus]